MTSKKKAKNCKCVDCKCRDCAPVCGCCGGNCIDMDLVVWNAARRRVGADTEPDARPVATFRGTAGERVTVGVTIPDCRRPARNPQMDEEPMWDCIYYTRLYRQG